MTISATASTRDRFAPPTGSAGQRHALAGDRGFPRPALGVGLK